MKLLALFSAMCIGLSLDAAPAIEEPRKLGNPDEWDPQGDMRFTRNRNGQINTIYRWPNKQVPYTFASGFNEANKAEVRRAMQSYSDLTSGCITFVPRTSQSDYVEYFDTESGCWSWVGRIGGKQQISLPQWCVNSYGSLQHEMYHALGFFHEQSRSDRDSYVTINLGNVQSGTENNFAKYSASQVTHFDEPYDYLSVMHYSQYAFTANGQPTIVTTDPAYQNRIGNRAGLSESDINKLKKMYDCTSTC